MKVTSTKRARLARKNRATTSLVVHRNGAPCGIVHIEGLFKTDGVLMPRTKPHAFRSTDAAEDAIALTQIAERRLRESLVADFVKARRPDLAPLFTAGTYTIERAKK